MTILHNLLNYATLNQLCIQAHTSSLRCGGSLCKVQSDNISTPHSNSLPIGRENKKPLSIRSTMRFRVAFGLFGMSENSSFPSTLRAWFAFAHSSPYRKSNRNDKRIGCSPPYPSPSWGGDLANSLPKLRGNRQNAPSPDWGRPGWGVSRKGLLIQPLVKGSTTRP